MTSNGIDGWRHEVLRAAGIAVTPHILDVLSAWRKSTPLFDQACNPLGMPARGSGYPAFLNTQYALFPGMTSFSAAFARFLGTTKGADLRQVMTGDDSLSVIWRAIHGLNWPASATETDYPAVLLDMVEQKYRSKLSRKTAAQRQTTGVVQEPPDVHDAVRRQAAALHHAASHISDTAEAVKYIMGRFS